MKIILGLNLSKSLALKTKEHNFRPIFFLLINFFLLGVDYICRYTLFLSFYLFIKNLKKINIDYLIIIMWIAFLINLILFIKK
jgi:hypothetical protein